MSLKTETLYAIRCDFPECRTDYDDGEHTYWLDPYYNADSAQDNEWLIGEGDDRGRDFCPDHSIELECPDGDDCEHDWTEHRVPLPDTWETRLRVNLSRLADDADRKLGYLEHRTVRDQSGALGARGRFAIKLNQELEGIFERAALKHDPDLTATDLFRLKRAS